MKRIMNRCSFLKQTALAAGALSAARLFPGPSLLAASEPSDRLT